jgi:hypothetical protein
MEFLVNIFIFLVLALAAAGLAVYLYILNQGDAKFEFLVSDRAAFKLSSLTQESAVFTTSVPFVNSGPQDGTIVDLFPRHLLPQEQFDKVKAESFVSRQGAERSDGYWEAVIIPKKTGGVLNVTVVLTAKEGGILPLLPEMVDMPVKLVAHIVARRKWYLQKAEIILPQTEIAAELLKRSLKEAN